MAKAPKGGPELQRLTADGFTNRTAVHDDIIESVMSRASKEVSMVSGKWRSLSACCVLAALCVGGCKSGERTAPTGERKEPGRVGGGPVEGAPGRAGADRAQSAIVEARCSREARCTNVGPGKKYESQAQCVQKI